MRGTIDFKDTKPFDRDTLRIKGGKIIANTNVFRFKDADTGQEVCYIPALEITGYGETEAKATEMARFSIEELFAYFAELSPKKRDMELSKLGWKQEKLKNREFSKVVVDVEGELKNFNAAEGTVKRLTLEAA